MAKKPGQNKKNITLITTHMNADFDGIGSMLAAQKLYHDSIVVFPGAYEKNIRNFFVNSMAYLFNIRDIGEIDFSSIKRLVLVDTRRKSRIGKLASLIEMSEMQVHVYDHHPPLEGDIKPDYDVHEPLGATVTILSDILKQKQIPISPEEATIMCLGIYEDTGSFSFPSTTEKDFLAAAFLLSKGANLNTVSDMITREINPEQLRLLNEMLQSATHYKIYGLDIVVTIVSTENYVNDFAFLVHKMVKMESLSALFAVARMGGKIYVTARSRIPEVNALKILSPLNGGGHAFAAAATIKEKTLAQTENLLMKSLYQNIRPSRRALDLMSSPAISIGQDLSCKNASKMLTRYNVNALLVSENIKGEEILHGFISRQVIEKALFHKLGSVPVKEYMSTEMEFVGPGADLGEIQKKIIENKQRILPVVKDKKLIGVITRTDLLNILVSRSNDKDGKLPVNKQPSNARTRNVKKLMQERLSKDLIQILKSIGRVAEEIGFNAFVVGGFVRDLFLYRKNDDLDIVIEGNGIAFAKKYAGIEGARIHTYEKFGTAVIIFPDGLKIDVATARMEYYKFPAALPTVEMSSIKLDLFRRDFTINTLAIQLSPDTFGTLIDFFSAQRDLKEKIIRVLHNLSFVEDPTRVFRAIRFEQRFGFSMGKLTSGLIRNAIKMDFFKKLSGRRVFSELRQILMEENPVPALTSLSKYNLFKLIHKCMKIDKKTVTTLNSVKKVIAWHSLLFLGESYNKWAVYFLVIISGLDRETTLEVCDRLELAPKYAKLFTGGRFEAENCLVWLEQRFTIKNSDLYHRLSIFKTELILYIMAATKFEKVKRSISLYFTNLRNTEISLRGRDLIAMGLKPGPEFKKILDKLLDARLNGKIKTRQDELDFVQKLIADCKIGINKQGVS